MLCAGLWLGGHPAKLPGFLRDAFVDGSAGLNAEATEVIEDNYYRQVRPTELSNSSLQGMVRGLRRRYHDRFSDYFSPESLEQLQRGDRRPVLRDRPRASPRSRRGLRVDQVFKGSPADEGGIEVGDVIVSVDGDSIAGAEQRSGDGEDQGAGRDRGDDRRARPDERQGRAS